MDWRGSFTHSTAFVIGFDYLDYLTRLLPSLDSRITNGDLGFSHNSMITHLTGVFMFKTPSIKMII